MPTCCGQALPRDVLGIVLTNAEVDLVADNVLPSPDEVSLRDSGYSEDGMSSIDLPRILDTHVLVSEPSTMPVTPTHEIDDDDVARLASALESETFRQLKMEQREQYQRISVFEANQRRALAANQPPALERLATQLRLSKVEKAQEVSRQLLWLPSRVLTVPSMSSN